MSKISIRSLFFTEDAREDEEAIRKSIDSDGVNLQILCVDNLDDMNSELDNRVWDVVLISELLINTPLMRVLEVLDQRPQKIPHLVLVGSLDNFSAVALLEKTGTLQQVTKTTMGTLLLMIHAEMKQADARFENSLILRRATIDMMAVWGSSLELRDKGTQGHTERVTAMTVKLARKLGVPKADINFIRQGALLHDIGKIGIPDSILLKAGPLSDEEWVVMKMHPAHAYKLLEPIKDFKNSLDIPYCHHEKWLGTGYPRGMAGKAIPLAARIFAVVDVYDALTTDRPYRKAWTKADTLAHIEKLSGSDFDPEIVPVFLEMMKEST